MNPVTYSQQQHSWCIYHLIIWIWDLAACHVHIIACQELKYLMNNYFVTGFLYVYSRKKIFVFTFLRVITRPLSIYTANITCAYDLGLKYNSCVAKITHWKFSWQCEADNFASVRPQDVEWLWTSWMWLHNLWMIWGAFLRYSEYI